MKALALPRDQWADTLARAGSSNQHEQLIIELLDADNAGRIDVVPNAGERAFDTTPLDRAIADMVASIGPR